MVHHEMSDAGIVPWGTEVKNPDFGAVARAIGLHGERVEKAEDICDAISRAFDYSGPALIDFVTDPATSPSLAEDLVTQQEKQIY